MSLWSDLDSALATASSPGPDGARNLLATLTRHRSALVSPLQVAVASPTLREELKKNESLVINGRQRKVNASLIPIVIQVSDELKLSESESARLVLAAAESTPRDGNDLVTHHHNIATAAVRLWYDERQAELRALATLLKLRSSPDIHVDAQTVIVEFTNDLLAQSPGLFENLCKQILQLNGEQLSASSVVKQRRGAALDAERLLLAESLFYIAYQCASSGARVLAVIDACTQCAAQLQLGTDPGLAATAHTLLATLACQLDRQHALIDAATGLEQSRGNERLLLDNNWIKDFQARLQADKWQHSGLRGAALLAWAVFVSSHGHRNDGGPIRPDGGRAAPPLAESEVEKVFADAVKSGALQYLTSVAASDAYRTNTETRHLLAGVFDELVTGLLSHLSFTNFALCPPPPSTASVGGDSNQIDSGDNLISLMRLIGELYRGEAALAEKFWTYGSGVRNPLYHFIGFAGDNVCEPLFAPYVNMLAALAGGRRVAGHAFRFLQKGKAKYVSWQHFFDALHGFVSDLLDGGPSSTQQQQQQQQQQNQQQNQQNQRQQQQQQRQNRRDTSTGEARQLRPADARNVAAMLRLMRVVLRRSPAARALLLGTPQWRAPETLVALLSCAVPTDVKAALASCMAALTADRATASRMWHLLDACQLLRTRVQHGAARRATAARDLRYELDSIEARAEQYALTHAFVRLIDKLIQHSAPRLHASTPVQAFTPYLAFVRDDVFARLESRSYTEPNERWALTASCLALFRSLLTKLDPFALGRDANDTLLALSQHNELLGSDIVGEWMGVSQKRGGGSALNGNNLDTERHVDGQHDGDGRGVLGIALMRDLLRGNGRSGAADGGSLSLLARVARVIEQGARHLVPVREAAARGLSSPSDTTNQNASSQLVPSALAMSVGNVIKQQSSDINVAAGRSTSGGSGGGAAGSSSDTSRTRNVLRQYGNGVAFEAAVYQALRVLELALLLEGACRQVLMEAGAAVDLAPLAEQLLRRDGAPVLAIAALLDADYPSRLALHATRILTLLSGALDGNGARRIAAVLVDARAAGPLADAISARLVDDGECEPVVNDAVAAQQRQDAFAANGNDPSTARATDMNNHLNHNSNEDDDDNDDEDEAQSLLDAYDEPATGDSAHTNSALRRELLQLMVSNVWLRSPSLAHVLLGFATTGALARSRIERSPRATAWTALLTLLRSERLIERCPRLAEQGYTLIAALAADRRSSAPTLAYVRTAPRAFFVDHVLLVDAGPVSSRAAIATPTLRARAALLRATALDLHSAASEGRTTYTGRLLARLFDVPPQDTGAALRAVSRPKMLEHLDALLSMGVPPAPSAPSLPALAGIDAAACVGVSARGVRVFDMRRLQTALRALLASRFTGNSGGGGGGGNVDVSGASTSVSGRAAINAAARDAALLLQHATAANEHAELTAARVAALEAWQALLGVAVSDCYSQLHELRREPVLLELLARLVAALSGSSEGGEREQEARDVYTGAHVDTAAPASLAPLLASAVLTLVTKLREAHARLGNDDTDTSLDLPFEQLYAVLDGLVAALLRAETAPVVRGTLCAALVHLLCLTAPKANELQGEWRPQRGAGVQAALRRGGQRLLLALAHDATDGVAVWRSVAFAALEAVLARADSALQDEWLLLLLRRGFLNAYVDDAVAAPLDALLAREPSADALAQLYTFESRMSFLLRLAVRARSAALLTQLGLLRRLADAPYLARCAPQLDDTDLDVQAASSTSSGASSRAAAVGSPSRRRRVAAVTLERGDDAATTAATAAIAALTPNSEFALTLAERRARLLQPTLQLAVALLSSGCDGGGGGDDAADELASSGAQFCEAHYELLAGVLRLRAREMNETRLESLRLVAALIYHVTWHVGPRVSAAATHLAALLVRVPEWLVERRVWQSRLAPSSAGFAAAPAAWRRRVEQIALDTCASALQLARVMTDEASAPPFYDIARATPASVNGAATRQPRERQPAPLGSMPPLDALADVISDALAWHVDASRQQAAAGRLLAAHAPGDASKRAERFALARDVAALDRHMHALRLSVETALLVLWRHAELAAASDAALGRTAAGTLDAKLRRDLVTLEQASSATATVAPLFIVPIVRRLEILLD